MLPGNTPRPLEGPRRPMEALGGPGDPGDPAGAGPILSFQNLKKNEPSGGRPKILFPKWGKSIKGPVL